MSFDRPAEHYDRFMGRFSRPLAPRFADAVELRAGQQVLDVGCGPGALTEVLAARLGPAAVTAVDPMPHFVAAVQERLPGVHVLRGGAEALPVPDDAVDRCLAQLVVPFMTDPVAGLAEMARVTRRGGLVAACVWDHTADLGPLSLFWRAAQDLDPSCPGEVGMAGGRPGELAQLFREAGLRPAVERTIGTSVAFDDVQQYWEPFELGIGPVGEHVASLDPAGREALRRRLGELVPAGGFVVRATAWFVAAWV